MFLAYRKLKDMSIIFQRYQNHLNAMKPSYSMVLFTKLSFFIKENDKSNF